MCMMVYVASDQPLPLIPWENEKSAITVSELDSYDEPVRSQFSKPFVCYIGAYGGCGCGFSYGQYDLEEDDEKVKGRKSVAFLSNYLATAIAKTGKLELYACWDGDQGKPPELRSTVSPDDFGGESFTFEERHFMTIVP